MMLYSGMPHTTTTRGCVPGLNSSLSNSFRPVVAVSRSETLDPNEHL